MKKVVLFVLLVFVFMPGQYAQAKMKIQEGEVLEAQKVKKKQYWFKRELADLKINGKVKHIPENKKVIVPYFRVTFATGGKYINDVGGITTSKTKVMSKLNGVDEKTMQDITDAIYEDFIGQLQDQGFEVIDVSVLDENETYQKLAEKSDYPEIGKNSAQFTPDSRYFPGGIPIKAYMLARDVDALMLQADYVVNFIIVNRNETKFNILKDKSDVEVGQGINVFGKVSVINEKGPVEFIIQQPIVSQELIGEIADATQTKDKVSDGIRMVGSWVAGNGLGNRSSTNRVEVNADPEQYKLAAEDALSEANAVLTSFMNESIKESNE